MVTKLTTRTTEQNVVTFSRTKASLELADSQDGSKVTLNVRQTALLKTALHERIEQCRAGKLKDELVQLLCMIDY